MAETTESLSKRACQIFSLAASKIPYVGDLTEALADGTCTRSERKESYRKMRAVCFEVGKKPNDDATANENLRYCLESLAEMYAMKGNEARIRSFKIAYLYDATTGKWFRYKWKKVPEEAL
jgi:hypothetical protein